MREHLATYIDFRETKKTYDIMSFGFFICAYKISSLINTIHKEKEK